MSRKKQQESSGPDIGSLDLFDLIGQGDQELVEFLLRNTADPMTLLRKKDPQGLTPLRKAVALNKKAICKTLITYGAEPSVRDPLGKTVLHRAASVGSCDLIAPMLVSPDSCVNVQDRDGNTPLHYAVKGKHEAAVDWLLFLGADVNLKNSTDKLPRDMCPPDSPLVQRLNDASRDLRVEPMDLASAYVPQKNMARLGADGAVLLMTSDDWPSSHQFMLCVRKRAPYSFPPVPLRQDEEFFNDAVNYRMMYQLPEGMTRVKVLFTVFEELIHSELIMKITSKNNFLGEVPVTMSTYIMDDYTNYYASAHLDLKDQGVFVLVKRYKWLQLVMDETGVYRNPQHRGFVVRIEEDLPHWPTDFDYEYRREKEFREKEEMMWPLLDAVEEKKEMKKKQDEKDRADAEANVEPEAKSELTDRSENKALETETEDSYQYTTTDERDQSNNMDDGYQSNNRDDRDQSNNRDDGDQSSNNSKSKSTATKSVMLDTLPSAIMPASIQEGSIEIDPPVLLTGYEEDDCDDFYFISRGWGLYLQARPTINSQILLDVALQHEDFPVDTLMRCNSLFYTLMHSSMAHPDGMFTIQIPKITDFQLEPFVKVGTVLVFARRPLLPEEDEYPDPDDSQEETYIAEDGKSTRLDYWLHKEKERWSILPHDIANMQTRVVFKATEFTTYIAVQMLTGTEKWKSEDPDEESSEESGSDDDSDKEGGSDEEEEAGGGDDEEGEGKKKKKKKKKGAVSKSSSDDGEGKEKKGKKTPKNESANNKSVDQTNNQLTLDSGTGAQPTDEPYAPAPSPQPFVSEFKDRSQTNRDMDSDRDSGESGSEDSESVDDESNSNNNSKRKGSSSKSKDTNYNKGSESTDSSTEKGSTASKKTAENVKSSSTTQKKQATGVGSVQSKPSIPSSLTSGERDSEDDLFANLIAEERTVAKGMPDATTSFFSLEPRPPPVDEEDLTPTAEPSSEELPLISYGKTKSFAQIKGAGHMDTLDYNYPSTEEHDLDGLTREVALMWRYRNHQLVSACIFTKHRAHEELSWDLIFEIVTNGDLVTRTEMWLAKGYSLLGRTKEFPLKSGRQLSINMHSLLIIPGPDGCQPGGVKHFQMWYSTNKVNYVYMVVKKHVEPKMGFGAKKGPAKKKDEVKSKEPDLGVSINLYYPGLTSEKELCVLGVFMDSPPLWGDRHLALRSHDNILLDKLIDYLQAIPEVSDQWWKIWMLLEYSEITMEKEKTNLEITPSQSIAKIIRQWFNDHLDNIERGILRVIHLLRVLKLDDFIADLIEIIKEYKSNYVVRKDVKMPRFRKLLIHWINDNKITENNIFTLIETPILTPLSDSFLLYLSQLLTGPLDELGAAMDVEENYLYMLNDDETITDPCYKPFKVLTKARQKHEDMVKYFVLLLDMVKKTNQPRQVGDFAISETHRWMESITDHKDICTKLESLFNTYVPNKDPSVDEAAPTKSSQNLTKGKKSMDGDKHSATDNTTTESTLTSEF